MAVLTLNQIRRMGTYTRVRDGYAVPNTNRGALFDCACWNWALTGGTVNANSNRNPQHIYDDIVQYDYDDANAIYAVGINDVDGNYEGCDAEFTALRDNLNNARAGQNGAKRAIRLALMKIAARRNGLVPISDDTAGPYVLYMKTGAAEWWSWHHWGLGVRLPTGAFTIVQTVPNVAIDHGCSVMWDEALVETAISLNAIHRAQVDVMNRIPPPPVRNTRCLICNAVHGQAPSIFNSWHQCPTCGATYCPTHGATLGGNYWYSSSRNCGVCGARTNLV